MSENQETETTIEKRRKDMASKNSRLVIDGGAVSVFVTFPNNESGGMLYEKTFDKYPYDNI